MWPKLFPAHAGVILSNKHEQFHETAFPRTRGGDPHDGAVGVLSKVLFPAHAGVIPSTASARASTRPFSPHAREGGVPLLHNSDFPEACLSRSVMIPQLCESMSKRPPLWNTASKAEGVLLTRQGWPVAVPRDVCRAAGGLARSRRHGLMAHSFTGILKTAFFTWL